MTQQSRTCFSVGQGHALRRARRPAAIKTRWHWIKTTTAFLLLSGFLHASTVTGKVDISQRAKSHESLGDIIVWLKPVRQNASLSVPPEHAQLLQKNKTFHPHVLPITVGSTVDFPNADPIFHNAFSSFDGQIFDVGLYAPGTSKSIHFHEPGIVRVFCNIHPTMSAVILVLDTPYFARVSADGRYRITKVPPGSYELRVFDERATAGPDVQLTVKVDDNEEQAAAPPIHLSELGYVRLPHKNKYGLDYPPNSSDQELYPGPVQ
jgi:plastocyanin